MSFGRRGIVALKVGKKIDFARSLELGLGLSRVMLMIN